jgi:hypothetical protein
MNTYKVELKMGKRVESRNIDAAYAGVVYGRLCRDKSLVGYEITNCHKGGGGFGVISYHEVVGLIIEHQPAVKKVKAEVGEFSFCEEVDKECDNLTK